MGDKTTQLKLINMWKKKQPSVIQSNIDQIDVEIRSNPTSSKENKTDALQPPKIYDNVSDLNGFYFINRVQNSLYDEEEKNLLPEMLNLLKMVTKIMICPGCHWLDGFQSGYPMNSKEEVEKIVTILNRNEKSVYLLFEYRSNKEIWAYWKNMW